VITAKFTRTVRRPTSLCHQGLSLPISECDGPRITSDKRISQHLSTFHPYRLRIHSPKPSAGKIETIGELFRSYLHGRGCYKSNSTFDMPTHRLRNFEICGRGWYATVPTPRLPSTSMPTCRVGLTPVTAQLPHEAFPLLDADATCRNDAAHHCEYIRK
jgi:hypothetical protein